MPLRRLVLTALVLAATLGAETRLLGQVSELGWRQLTTADGLPSSETYFAYEDQAGYLWVGTDNGLARYDGYEFKVFDADDGLEDGVVFMIQEWPDGTIWVSTLSGRVYYVKDNRLYPYRHNDKILQYKESRELMFLVDVLPDTQLVFKVKCRGFVQFDRRGDDRLITNWDDRFYYLYRTQYPGSIFPRTFRYFDQRTRPPAGAKRVPVVINEGASWRPLLPRGAYVFGLQSSRPALDLTETGGGIFIVRRDSLIHFRDSSERAAFPYSASDYVHPAYAGDNKLLLAQNGGRGLVRLELDYGRQTVRADTFLNGRSLSTVSFDRRGGLWVASLDGGIFYAPYPNQELFRAEGGVTRPHPTALALVDSNRLFGAYTDGTLQAFATDAKKRYEGALAPNQVRRFETDDLFYLADRKALVSYYGLYRVDWPSNAPARLREIPVLVDEKLRFGIKEVSVIDDTIFWTGPQNYGVLDPEMKRLSFRFPEDRGGGPFVHGLESFAVFPDGRRFIGTWYGLKQLINGDELVHEDLGIPELNGRIERIVPWGEDRMAIGTRAHGIIVWARDTHYVVGLRQGLASDIVRNLHVTDDGHLWVATLKGLSKLRFNENGPPSVRTFNSGNGLLDNEVHDIDSYGDAVWLASTRGIYRFEEPAFDSVSAPPVIQGLTVNGEDAEADTLYRLRPFENNLAFSFRTTSFALGQTQRYRYRIAPPRPWRISRERVANYADLPVGEYLFEVQSENQDGVWSESTLLPVTIAEYWYLTTLAKMLWICLLVGGISAAFIVRSRRRRREQELLAEITRLQHSALYAQMNPHFVFNCLNSIQNFIVHNETRQATRYLARFAHLVRNTLDSSVQGYHTLEEEIDMLRRYLELEKLRFKEVFDYSVDVDPRLLVGDLNLPPLLVQPFVENAVLHAFGEEETGGKIKVYFGGDINALSVTVTDNGVGFDLTDAHSEDAHGMRITRRRLELLYGGKRAGTVLDVQPVVDAAGCRQGTTVRLLIRPLQQFPPDPAT